MRRILPLLFLLCFALPAWGQQSTKTLLSTFAPTSSSEFELTDLANTVAVTSTAHTFLSSFTLVAYNSTSRTISVTLRVTRDGATEGTQAVSIPAGTSTLQVNTTMTSLTVASHTWRCYATSTVNSGVTYTTSSTHYLGNVAGLSVVDTSGALLLAGGTMLGAINMGTNKITNLGTPTAGTDAATKTYADGVVSGYLKADGSVSMSGALAMGTNKITGLGTPTLSTDAATKAYVDLFGKLTSAQSWTLQQTLNAAPLVDITSVAAQLDELLFARSGTQKGRIGLDSSDRFRLSGPNLSSNAITIDGSDFVQIGPAVASPGLRLYVTDDTQVTGTLRVGPTSAFGAAAVDPDGVGQFGRAITAQAHGLTRYFRNGTEMARIGLDANDHLALMAGAADSPAFVVNGAVMEVTGNSLGSLPASPNGSFSYCSNCTVTSGADNTCAGSGTGALAVRLNGVWRCFQNQN